VHPPAGPKPAKPTHNEQAFIVVGKSEIPNYLYYLMNPSRDQLIRDKMNPSRDHPKQNKEECRGNIE
jgi:hypothetical protein